MYTETMQQEALPQLMDLYAAARELFKALPRLVRTAFRREVKRDLLAQFKALQVHLMRIEQVFGALGMVPVAEGCEMVTHLLHEARAVIAKEPAGDERDAAILIASRRMMQYQSEGYRSLIELSREAGREDIARYLGGSLRETEAARQHSSLLLNYIVARSAGPSRTKRRAVELPRMEAAPPATTARNS